jgi:hypothetical protein
VQSSLMKCQAEYNILVVMSTDSALTIVPAPLTDGIPVAFVPQTTIWSS